MSGKMLIYLLTTCTFYLLPVGCTFFNNHTKNLASDHGRRPWTNEEVLTYELDLPTLLVVYYNYYGVHDLIITLCHEDMVSPKKQERLLQLVRKLQIAGFYVRIFDGRDYMSLNVEIPKPIFGPPITFHSDNATKRALKFDIKQGPNKIGIVMLSFVHSCGMNVLNWSAASEQNLFTTHHYWLLLTTDLKNDVLLLENEEFFFPPDSEVRIIKWSDSYGPDKFDLVDVYKVSAEKPLRQRIVGIKIKSISNLLSSLKNFGSAISYRENLEGISFKSGLVIAFPDLFTNIEDVSSRHIDTISKVNNRLTVELANKLNIRFNTHQTDNYGWRQPNGSFDGLMGRFQRYELDFAQNAIFMRLDRIAICDFVAETFRVHAGIMFRQPSLSAVANIFAMPFQYDVWISILVMMIFTTIVFSLELLLAPYALALNYWDCGLFVWAALCQQSFHLSMENRSARIIVLTTFVTTLFLFTSFSANIVALLQSPSTAIQTLSDLSQSPLDIGVQDTVYNKVYFTESTDPVTNRLYTKKIAPKGDSIYMRPKVGIAKMRNELFAYQVELQAGYQIISETFSEPEKCGLMELEPFQLPMIAIPTRKNFPYKELFRRQLRWQREVGLINREALKWFPQRPKCEGGFGGFVSIGLTECRYALGIFGCGILISFCFFLLELLTKYCICFIKFRIAKS